MSERKNDYTRWSCEQRERAQKKCPQQQAFIKRIPCCSIEKDYSNTAFGQLRTRFQAFVESVKIKKLQKGEGEA
ncbi:MAG: 2-hydroxyacyl-CoA dehydratase [Oscillibacter sp.]|nr:2-hydroxyacyl-CoA dehydratase [Oscillibacter sp.]